MMLDYELQHEDAEQVAVPNYESEFINAKIFLQKASTYTGDNLYDHLTEVLNQILAERPENVIDFFEEYSRKVKEKRFRPMTDHLEDIYVPPGRYELANRIMPLLKPVKPDEPSTVDPADLELADMTRNNMLELLYYFEQVGIGLPRTEMFCLTLSIKKLIYTEPIATVRFWGKIYGTFKNYIILEAELKDDVYMKRNEENEARKAEEEKKALEAVNEEEQKQPDQQMEWILNRLKLQQEIGAEDSKIPRQLPGEPKVVFESPPDAPEELSGIGVNKKVYYVCNEVGEPWVELPNVTPKQIVVAKKIYKSFTGNLDEDILTYPEFPGKEREYLRAQIARISAGTQISPLGYYKFGAGGGGEDEEEEEEEAAPGEGKTNYSVNPKYEAPPLKDLLDASMSFWVHHTPYILPQGRTTWWNPSPMPDMGEEEGEGAEEEVEAKAPGAEPETGPGLLTPCSEDATLEGIPPWSVRCSSNIIEDFAIAFVRSNLWPGAYCFSTQGKMFQNVYLGNGLKYLEHNFSPLPLPYIQQEYPIGPEILEMTDPTGAEEEQWRIDHLPKPQIPAEVAPEELEEELEEEEEEEEDED